MRKDLSLESIRLKFSFIFKKNNEIEIYQVNMKQLTNSCETNGQYSFVVKLKNIAQPTQIRLKLDVDSDQEEIDEDIHWYLDHVSLLSRNRFRKILIHTPRKSFKG